MPETVHLKGTRTVSLEGPQHYEKALRKVLRRNKEVDSRVPFTATLVREPRNKYDPSAVAVQAQRKTVGYLPSAEAAKYCEPLDRLGSATVTVDAAIYAGHKGGAYWSVGVRMPRPDRMPG